MLFDDYVDRVVAIVKEAYLTYPTVERYIGQFNPEEDDRLTYTAPAILIAPVSAVRHTEQHAPYDLDWVFGAVLVRDELDRSERDSLGWIDVEKLANVLDSTAGIGEQANVPFIESVTKTNRQDAASNSGYSYWTILWSVAWRIERPFFREL